jgi:hypothetical protein
MQEPCAVAEDKIINALALGKEGSAGILRIRAPFQLDCA